jgi:hypothetical protein
VFVLEIHPLPQVAGKMCAAKSENLQAINNVPDEGLSYIKGIPNLRGLQHTVFTR